jgi:hypothetical protein
MAGFVNTVMAFQTDGQDISLFVPYMKHLTDGVCKVLSGLYERLKRRDQ